MWDCNFTNTESFFSQTFLSLISRRFEATFTCPYISNELGIWESVLCHWSLYYVSLFFYQVDVWFLFWLYVLKLRCFYLLYLVFLKILDCVIISLFCWLPVGTDLGPSLREICAANRSDEKQVNCICSPHLSEFLCF